MGGLIGGEWTTGVFTSGYVNVTGNTIPSYQQQVGQAGLQQLMAQLQSQEKARMPCGTKPVVICAGLVEECKDLDAAQAKAEELAHQKSADAYILKPIKRVAPKRDVVTTDLP